MIEGALWTLDLLPFEELREDELKIDPREGREDEEPRDEEPRDEEPRDEEPREEEPREELEDAEPLEGLIEDPREPLWAWA